MPVTLTKKQLDKLLQEERVKVNVKNKQSRFMKRTLSIYNSQRARLREVTAQPKAELPFSLADLRAKVSGALGQACPYNIKTKLSVANFAVDHDMPISRGGSWSLSNLVVISQQSNFRKGSATGAEWAKFSRSLEKNFAPEFVEDIYRRLTLGGKWSNF
jgi:hypothetical protein